MRIGLSIRGTFDPVTNGHLDITGRAVKLVDKLVIGVAVNIGKGPLFSLDERVAIPRLRDGPPDQDRADRSPAVRQPAECISPARSGPR